MATSLKSISINAPVEKVFAFVENPANIPDLWPSLLEAKNIVMMENGGYQYDWLYKMAGMKVEGSTKTVEYIKNEKIVDQTLKGVDSKFTWTFKPEQDTTNVTLGVEYTIPVPVLGRLAESVFVRQNEKEGEILLQNLKARMES